MCCLNCGWLRWVTTTGTSYYCEFVGGKFLGDLSDCCEAWKPTMRTNADRIRAMSDEELAEFMCHSVSPSGVVNCVCCEAQEFCRMGHNGYLDWLKEEVKE